MNLNDILTLALVWLVSGALVYIILVKVGDPDASDYMKRETRRWSMYSALFGPVALALILLFALVFHIGRSFDRLLDKEW